MSLSRLSCLVPPLSVALACVFATAWTSAAPVRGFDAIDGQFEFALPTVRVGTLPTTTARMLDRSLYPEASTGNKDLDLLLESKGPSGEEPRRAAPRSAAAASAAAAELAVLRAKAAQPGPTPPDEPIPREQAERGPADRPKLALRIVESLETLQGDARLSEPVARREWERLAGGRGGYGESMRATGSSGGSGYDDDHPLRRALREVIELLHDNRFWLLGTVGSIAVLGAVLKAYSRRI